MVRISPDTIRLAIILGVVLPGVGHIYLGNVSRGIKIVLILIFSGTISGVLVSYVDDILNKMQVDPYLSSNINDFVSAAASVIPLIVWIWQIRDLRRITKNLSGLSVEELEPPHLEIEGENRTEGIICPSCGRHNSNESRICNNCGLILK